MYGSCHPDQRSMWNLQVRSCKCVLFAKIILTTIYNFKTNSQLYVWFMSSSIQTHVKIVYLKNSSVIHVPMWNFADKELQICFIFKNITKKSIRTTIYKFKTNSQFWQMCGSRHPVFKLKWKLCIWKMFSQMWNLQTRSLAK